MRRALATILLGLVLAACVAGCASEPKVWLTSWTFVGPNSAEPVPVTLPVHLDDRLPNAPSRYTLRTTVALPPELRGQTLTIATPYLPAIASLRVNGRAATQLEQNQVEVYRGSGPRRWRVPDEESAAASLDLELTIEHRWTQSAWIDSIPTLSAQPRGDPAFERAAGFNVIGATVALSTMVLLALAYGIVYLSGRRRAAHGWYALEAIAGAFYPAFMLGLTQPVLGTYDVPVMALMLTLSAIATVHFSRAELGLGPARRVWWAPLLLCIAVSAVASSPFRSTRWVAPIAAITMMLNVAYQLVLLRRVLRMRPRSMSLVLVLLAWPIAAISCVADFGGWLGLGEAFGGVRAACAGIAVSSMIQAAALSLEHKKSLNSADDLNAELAARVALLEASNREIAQLNQELRRQIGARSEQLADVMSRVGDLASSALTLEPGAVVEGRYEVLRPIGSGGMGAVYEVSRVHDGRRLALKVLHGDVNGKALARFAREAQLTSQIDHPNIVSIVDVGTAAPGALFLVMELVEGSSLEDLRDRYGDVAWALPLLRQIADGLTAVHAKGIIHRDLKPANVLVAKGPVAKIADFGISTLAADDGQSPLATTRNVRGIALDESPRLTQTGVILGTPLYMAPEMMRGATYARPASDVFSLGVIAFEMLTRTLPFSEASIRARLHGRSGPPAAMIRSACAALDDDIADLVDRCVSLDASQRPSAHDLALALGRRSSGAGAVASR